MANEYNILESVIVAALKLDAWLGDTDNVALIEEKLTPNYEAGYEHQFPRIGVFITGEDPTTDIDQAYYIRTYNVLVEVACQGGYAPDVDSALKRILAELRRFFQEQNRLDTRLSDEDIIEIQNGAMDVTLNFEIEQSRVYIGQTYLKITMNQE